MQSLISDRRQIFFLPLLRCTRRPEAIQWTPETASSFYAQPILPISYLRIFVFVKPRTFDCSSLSFGYHETSFETWRFWA
jgi:hypothetical protein